MKSKPFIFYLLALLCLVCPFLVLPVTGPDHTGIGAAVMLFILFSFFGPAALIFFIVGLFSSFSKKNKQDDSVNVPVLNNNKRTNRMRATLVFLVLGLGLFGANHFLNISFLWGVGGFCLIVIAFIEGIATLFTTKGN